MVVRYIYAVSQKSVPLQYCYILRHHHKYVTIPMIYLLQDLTSTRRDDIVPVAHIR